jgi:chromosome segregation ATPase
MNDTQKAAVQEEIAETQARLDTMNATIADYQLSIQQNQKALSSVTSARNAEQAKLTALQEGLA